MSVFITASDLMAGDCIYVGSTYHAVSAVESMQDGSINVYFANSREPLRVSPKTKFDAYFAEEAEEDYDE